MSEPLLLVDGVLFPTPDPFDRCVCGHTRRAHFRSYDNGSGQGGCAGRHTIPVYDAPYKGDVHHLSTQCRCDQFKEKKP